MGKRAAEKETDALPEPPETSETQGNEDTLPELFQYRDEGCDLAESCLNCPFIECIYDRPGGKRRWRKEERAAEMTRLVAEEGKSLKELATMFGVSCRTVQRDLKAHIKNVNRRAQNDR